MREHQQPEDAMGKKRVNLKSVGENIDANQSSWTFNGEIAKTFLDHVRRSVPFYDVSHDLICKYSDFFLKPKSICYDLGCSTGNLLNGLVDRHKSKKGIRWVGIDVEKGMIEQAKKVTKNSKRIKFVVDDIATFSYEKSDLMISYYTMQFCPPHIRQDVFDKIYQSLNWGGALILFEKVRAPDARFQDIAQTLYADYKLEQNYSPSEIIAKTRSLKGVLEPFSTQGNLDLLKRAGFVDIMTIFKYICFEGFIAIK